MTSEMNVLFNRIESMLFTAGDPVPITEIARVLCRSKEETVSILKEMELQRNADAHGVLPLVTDETVQLISNRIYLLAMLRDAGDLSAYISSFFQGFSRATAERFTENCSTPEAVVHRLRSIENGTSPVMILKSRGGEPIGVFPF